VVGTWKGETSSPAGQGRVDLREYVFRANGTFESEYQSSRTGFGTTKGTYKVDGDRATIDGIAVRSGRPHQATLQRVAPDTVQWDSVSTLDGKALTGTLKRIK
jgi:hypothetical protein